MRNAKISPEVVAKSVRTIHREYPWNDHHGDADQFDIKDVEVICEEYDVRRQSGYWHARSVFLRSYKFSFSEDKEGWRKNVKKKVKEMNKKAIMRLEDKEWWKKMAVKKVKEMCQKARMSLLEMRGEVLVRRKFAVKVLVVTVDVPTAATFAVRCSIPTIKKITQSVDERVRPAYPSTLRQAAP